MDTIVTQIGSLVFAPVLEHLELLAEPVQRAVWDFSNGISASIGISEIDPEVSDTASFCEKYDIGLEVAANCVIVEGKRGEERKYAACIILATSRADVNGIVRKELDARKVSFAQKEEAVSRSNMEFGAITPIGLPSDWPIFVDSDVANSAYVIIGSGIRKSKLAIPGKLLGVLPNVKVIEGLGVIKE